MGSASTAGLGHLRNQRDAPRRTALVLSAGGMFGAYQAGVWSVLEPLVKPDIVVGASIGSLNGWFIASGNPAEQLENSWLHLDRAAKPKWRFPRQISDGILDSTVVENRIRELHSQYSPVVRYGLVATELRNLRPTLFEYPDVTWQHLAASCGVPVFLRQHRIDGILYADGGLIHPLPLWAAVEMGATHIIAVNVMKNRPFLLRAVTRAARAYSAHSEHSPDHVDVVEICPTESLGSARDSMYWRRANAEKWIALGKKDAGRIKHLVVECSQRV